jgi:hypothetical protein
LGASCCGGCDGRWRYSRPDDRIFDFDGNAYWTETKQEQTKIANGTPGSLGNPITGFVGDARSFDIDTKGFDLNNTSRVDLGPFRNAFTYGGDFFRDDVVNIDPTGNGAVTTPNGVRTVWVRSRSGASTTPAGSRRSTRCATTTTHWTATLRATAATTCRRRPPSALRR